MIFCRDSRQKYHESCFFCSLGTALNRSFYMSTSSTTSVRADSSALLIEEIQVLWSQSYATEILSCHVQVYSKHSSGQCNAMSSCYLIDTTGTTYTFYKIERRKETIKENTKTKKTNRKRKRKKKYRTLRVLALLTLR